MQYISTNKRTQTKPVKSYVKSFVVYSNVLQ